jgi:hypothetical protein
MKNFTVKSLFVLFAIVSVFFASIPVMANGGYTKAQVDRIIKNAETRSDIFVKSFDRALDHSRLNGSAREDYLNKRAKDLEKALDELRREFDRRDLWIENRDEVRKCLNIATDINVAMKNRRFGFGVEANWAALRAELNMLAQAYGLPKVGSPAY